MTFSELQAWAARIPSLPPGNEADETLSYAVPYRDGDLEGERAARYLAVAYMRSALEDKLASSGSAVWVRPLTEDVTRVERREQNFWARVVRSGWSYYRVHCRVACVIAEAAE